MMRRPPDLRDKCRVCEARNGNRCRLSGREVGLDQRCDVTFEEAVVARNVASQIIGRSMPQRRAAGAEGEAA